MECFEEFGESNVEAKNAFDNELVVEGESPEHECVEFLAIDVVLRALDEFDPRLFERVDGFVVRVEELHERVDDVRDVQLHRLFEQDRRLRVFAGEVFEHWQ